MSSARLRQLEPSSPQTAWALAAGLMLIVCIAYVPAMNAGFIWDDDVYVTENLTLRSLHGLYQIWFERGITPQYYPLVHTTFWLEYRLWGLNAAGYHIVNIALHAIGSVLLWIVLRRLRLSAATAWVAAAVFAVHPVHVESVAWITERKNVLSLVLYLGALLAYLRFAPLHEDDALSPRRWRWYGLAMILFISALLSKSVTCSLPAAIVLLIYWKRARMQAADVVPLLPMFAVGLVAGLNTAWMEKNVVGAAGADWEYTVLERLLIAGRCVWFYAAKLLGPANLSFIYERWEIDARQAWHYVYPLGAMALLIAVYLWRGTIGRGPLVALLFFGGTLVPALGFFDVYPFRFAFVADHFQYHASIGVIVLIVALADRGLRPVRFISVFLAITVLATLIALTFRQARVYENIETLWRDTLAKNSGSFMPLYNLAQELVRQGRIDEAIPYYEKTFEIRPDWVEAMNSLGVALAQRGETDRAIELYHRALRVHPDFPDAMASLGAAYARQRRIHDAIPLLERAIELQPNLVNARLDLGVAFMTQGRADEGIAQFEQALAQDPQSVAARVLLANALRERGDHQRATQLMREADQLQRNDN